MSLCGWLRIAAPGLGRGGGDRAVRWDLAGPVEEDESATGVGATPVVSNVVPQQQIVRVRAPRPTLMPSVTP